MPGQPGRDTTRAGQFAELSALLTGFGQIELLGTGMACSYLRAIDAVLPEGVLDELLGAFGRLPPGTDGEAREAAARSSILDDPKLGPVARNLIVVWYCGTWTALPDAWRTAYGTSPLDVDRVLSAESYQAGLQWVAAGAHPAGALQQGYGAWSAAPEAPQAAPEGARG
ncbi:MAG TPA: hypothetical protein VIX15_08200 [Streptosporangiaceae bacterium]